ncbi:AAA family ATPase [Selenihalanaerobacter shriftii]|uniref:Nuclease SbcCD subunit C n=1 Tax=Selenihalanaerobacter shriftii TaxID=142842 RepID=A0A1T4NF88_9FIRM|nr:AAA family ATPase [Selenihalanaerobacter shriftii]SJZ77458.1 exonuclease SbcC [Selenihalanaerobacter shriftii]
MKIINFESEIFAGLKDSSLSFVDGLNVVLGPNESGKSTLVNAIQATLFKDAKVGRRKTEDINFRDNFLPHFGGDYINGKLKIEYDRDLYILNKRWGNDHYVEFEPDDGAKITKPENVKARLNDIFKFGEKTYENLIFTKQQTLKDTIEQIIDDDETTNQLGEIIRKAVMKLDGVSPDKLRDKIADKKKDLLAKWDVKNSRPQNNRGIHNKYIQGTGKVIDSFYKKEELKQKKEDAKRIEKEFEEVSSELNDLKEEKKELTEKINKLAELESDILKRGQIEPKLENITTKVKDLKKIAKEWPTKEERLKNQEEKLKELNERIDEMEESLQTIDQIKSKIEFEKDLEKVDACKKNIKELKEEIEKLPEINEEQLKQLEDLSDTILKSKTTIESATLIGSLNKSNSKVKITTGLDDEEEIEAGAEFKANAYLKIEVEDSLELEIRAGEVDFVEKKVELEEAGDKKEELLQSLGVNDLEDARIKEKELRDKKSELKNEESNLIQLLDGRDYQELQSRQDALIQEIGESKLNVNQREDIETKLKKLKDEDRLDLRNEISTLKSKIEEWEEEYNNSDEILDKMVDLKTEKQAKEKELDQLTPLPEKFEKAEDFQRHLTQLRKEKDKIEDNISNKTTDYYQKKDELPDSSYEELQISYEEAQKDYGKQLKEANAILRVEEAFKEAEEEMDQDPFGSLKESFSDYLQTLTDHNYEVGVIDKNFDIKVMSEEDKGLPLELLSAGTYAGVALAFRFALLEYLYDEEPGFVVLDDCLVDLDPARKEAAVKVINDFAKNNQVIFTTCDPETAELFGGNVIEV